MWPGADPGMSNPFPPYRSATMLPTLPVACAIAGAEDNVERRQQITPPAMRPLMLMTAPFLRLERERKIQHELMRFEVLQSPDRHVFDLGRNPPRGHREAKCRGVELLVAIQVRKQNDGCPIQGVRHERARDRSIIPS